MKTRRNIAVIAAAGSSSEIGSPALPIQYVEIDGTPILAMTLKIFENSPMIDEVVLVVGEDYLAYASSIIVDRYGFRKIRKITCGGKTRQESVLAGLSACPPTGDSVIIHDGTSPFVRQSLIENLFEAVQKTGAAIPVIKAGGAVKLIDENGFCRALSSDMAMVAQRPQIYNFAMILDCHRRAEAAKFETSDDSQIAENYGIKIVAIPGHNDNIKIAGPDDLILAREIARRW